MGQKQHLLLRMRPTRNILNPKQLKSSVLSDFHVTSLHYKQISTADGYQTKIIQLLMDKYETSK